MKKLFAIAIALSVSCSFAQTNDIIYSNLRSSDQWLINDIFMANINSSCIKNAADGQCDLLLGYWSARIGDDQEGKKYLESLANKPPHIKNQIMKADFAKRYRQILELKDENICFDSLGWKLFNSDTGYFMAGDVSNVTERPTANKYKIIYGTTDRHNGAFPAELILLDKSNSYIQEIPNKYITEDIYVKLKALLGSSYMRICGKVGSLYSIKQLVGRELTRDEMQNYSVSNMVVNFTISKPIEFYKNDAKAPSMTIPLQWYK